MAINDKKVKYDSGINVLGSIPDYGAMLEFICEYTGKKSESEQAFSFRTHKTFNRFLAAIKASILQFANDDQKTMFLSAISSDDFSVREKSAIKLARDKFGLENVTWVLDPVFLCPLEDYKRMENIGRKSLPDKKFLFAYILDPNKEKEIQYIFNALINHITNEELYGYDNYLQINSNEPTNQEFTRRKRSSVNSISGFFKAYIDDNEIKNLKINTDNSNNNNFYSSNNNRLNTVGSMSNFFGYDEGKIFSGMSSRKISQEDDNLFGYVKDNVGNK